MAHHRDLRDSLERPRNVTFALLRWLLQCGQYPHCPPLPMHQHCDLMTGMRRKEPESSHHLPDTNTLAILARPALTQLLQTAMEMNTTSIGSLPGPGDALLSGFGLQARMGGHSGLRTLSSPSCTKHHRKKTTPKAWSPLVDSSRAHFPQRPVL